MHTYELEHRETCSKIDLEVLQKICKGTMN
jgi:hypothetical protein